MGVGSLSLPDPAPTPQEEADRLIELAYRLLLVSADFNGLPTEWRKQRLSWMIQAKRHEQRGWK